MSMDIHHMAFQTERGLQPARLARARIVAEALTSESTGSSRLHTRIEQSLGALLIRAGERLQGLPLVPAEGGAS